MNFSGIEYLCIDIANCYGLDKDLFQDRINWVKQNFNQLEEYADNPDIEDKYLYIKSVQALRDVVAGKPTGHLISLDSTCSGLQILSALTCDPNGARITNLTGENKRYDAYTEITDTQNTVIGSYGFTGNTVSRKDSKQAVMTSLYGSEKTPKDIFGEDGPLLEAFYEACFKEAPGAFSLLSTMKQAWQPGALSHYWKLPDGFDCAIKVMQSFETRIEVDELNKHKFTTSYEVNEGTKKGISLAANITHSVDAYVLRTLIRRCSYNPKTIKVSLKLLTVCGNTTVTANDPRMVELVQLTQSTGMLETSMLQFITEDNVTDIPKPMRQKLIALAEDMLQYKPFDILTVHDAFRIHPNNGNALRYWYKEILAELAESKLLNHILSMVTGQKVRLKKIDPSLPAQIREAIYPIC